MESPAGEADALDDDDPPLSRRFDMVEQAPSANAITITEPRRSPAAMRRPGGETRINRRIPDVRLAAFYPSSTRDASGPRLLDAENPAEV